MTIEKIYANLSCSSLEESVEWFAHLLGREPDARPMQGLVEWHHRDDAGLQLLENPETAGTGTLTLIVRDIQREHQRLTNSGLRPSEIRPADAASLIQLNDPNGNLVVLAQPK